LRRHELGLATGAFRPLAAPRNADSGDRGVHGFAGPWGGKFMHPPCCHPFVNRSAPRRATPRSPKMKNLIATFSIACAALLCALPASANNFAELRNQMSGARESLVTLLTNKDKRGTDQQKLVKDTADAVSATLARMKPPAGKDAQFKELVDTWAAFKKTREDELVPLILAGKDAEARKIAGGIQKERITRCQQLLGELGG
jgi:hypothetical protein